MIEIYKNKENLLADKETEPVKNIDSTEKMADLGDEIIKILRERTENPSEAFVLLQRLSILLWYQYKIDWQEKENQKVAPSRKQRYLDFISELIDILSSENEGSEQ
jgi:hypothetical protein